MTPDVADDSAARARAIDPQRSFIVQAPAGAGKTELLTQRFLVLLAVAQAPEEILAITFTRKAAAEMHHRIMAALERAAGEPVPAAAHERLTWQLAQSVLVADRHHGWNLRLNPARLRIQTIDALCAALARRMPVLSGFGAPARIVENAGALYREAARHTLAEVETGAQWSAAIEHLMRHLDNNLATIEGLIARMLAQRDQWLPHAAEVDRAALERTLAEVNAEALRALCAAVPRELAAELVELVRFALENLAAEGVDVSAALAALATGRLPGADAGQRVAWTQMASLLLTAEGGWRVRLTVREGFPSAARSAKDPAALRNREMKERMQALLVVLGDPSYESFRHRLHAVRGLPPQGYDDSQWETISALSELLRLAAAFLEVIFRERGEVDFTRIAQAALTALGEAERPSDLALALDRRIRHILVDEFQDTAQGQYRLLEGLTAGWERGDGRTLFLVGDPMQSIYRFREAEVGLYLRARREGIGSVELEPLGLTVNYRSQAGVIAWVNETFARVLPAAEDLASGAVPYTAARAHHPALDGEAVRMHALFGAAEEREAALVGELVDAALAGDPRGTVAVLVRSRGHLRAIVPALRQAGLRFRAVEIERLSHRPVIQDLLALACALTHPGDRASWLAVLRAPWCGLTLADLHALAGDAPRAAIPDLLRDGERLARLSEDGRRRLARVHPLIEHGLAERRRRSLRAWVEGVWIALGGPACVGDGDLDDAQVLLEVLDEVEEGGDLVERGALVERIERLYARPDPQGDARLQVMTIHKAKGLEFDTVIVPGLGRRPRAADTRLLMWLPRPQGDLLLAPIRETGAETDPIYRYISELDREKGRLEDGRLLYVAATRARRRLHLIGATSCREDDEGLVSPAPPPSTSLLARLWPAVERDFIAAAGSSAPAALAEEKAVAETPQARRVPLRRLDAAWEPPPVPSAVDVAWAPHVVAAPADFIEFAWAGETARHVGTVTHRLLQQCARAGINDAARLDARRVERTARLALAALGVPAADAAAAAAKVRTALWMTLDDDRGRWILDPAHDDARCEYALSGVEAGRVRRVVIDRCFIDADGVRWIIDYKTGVHQGAGVETFLDQEQARYREQLERYAELFRKREARRIRLGLYFPLLQGWREWEA
jgi:ATP-dependent exoDNAse (exonuclease V) beta subunit